MLIKERVREVISIHVGQAGVQIGKPVGNSSA
jgi:hypothetical protein